MTITKIITSCMNSTRSSNRKALQQLLSSTNTHTMRFSSSGVNIYLNLNGNVNKCQQYQHAQSFSTTHMKTFPINQSIKNDTYTTMNIHCSTRNWNNASTIRWHTNHSHDDNTTNNKNDDEYISITFINPHPSIPKNQSQSPQNNTTNTTDSNNNTPIVTVKAKIGDTILTTAHKQNIDLEGACEGVCACSTCHIIIQDEPTATDIHLPDPTEEEEDMLDMAYGVEANSRLGCQIVLTKDMDGLVLKLPDATRNFYVDGHVPQPH